MIRQRFSSVYFFYVYAYFFTFVMILNVSGLVIYLGNGIATIRVISFLVFTQVLRVHLIYIRYLRYWDGCLERTQHF